MRTVFISSVVCGVFLAIAPLTGSAGAVSDVRATVTAGPFSVGDPIQYRITADVSAPGNVSVEHGEQGFAGLVLKEGTVQDPGGGARTVVFTYRLTAITPGTYLIKGLSLTGEDRSVPVPPVEVTVVSVLKGVPASGSQVAISGEMATGRPSAQGKLMTDASLEYRILEQQSLRTRISLWDWLPLACAVLGGIAVLGLGFLFAGERVRYRASLPRSSRETALADLASLAAFDPAGEDQCREGYARLCAIVTRYVRALLGSARTEITPDECVEMIQQTASLDGIARGVLTAVMREGERIRYAPRPVMTVSWRERIRQVTETIGAVPEKGGSCS